MRDRCNSSVMKCCGILGRCETGNLPEQGQERKQASSRCMPLPSFCHNHMGCSLVDFLALMICSPFSTSCALPAGRSQRAEAGSVPGKRRRRWPGTEAAFGGSLLGGSASGLLARLLSCLSDCGRSPGPELYGGPGVNGRTPPGRVVGRPPAPRGRPLQLTM